MDDYTNFEDLKVSEEEYDPVEPPHYRSNPSGVEAIQVTQHMSFCIGNAMKYLWRCGLKRTEHPVTDLKKAIWYLEKEIKRLEERDEE